jgi:homoprotocatechuate degradation regulator HpaR
VAEFPVRPLHRNLPLLLLQARERVISYFRPILNAHGITEQQWRVVRVLLESSALEPKEIGELCGISSPSMAGMLSRMEQLGFITRSRLKHDQRRVRVILTPQARRLAARMVPAIDATYERLEAIMGTQAIERLMNVLDELSACLPELQSGKSDAEESDTPVNPMEQAHRHVR